jgi:hypothetical protein
MANTTSGLFETLVAAAVPAAKALKFSNKMLDHVYVGFEPNYATLGSTLNVNVPVVNEGDVNDIGSGDIVITDTSHNTYPIVFDKNQSTSFVIRNFDEIRTPQDLRNLYLDARLEALMRKVDRDLCSLVTSTNFNTYSSLTGGADVFTRANLATLWNSLAGGGVPVDDTANMFFLTSNLPYSNMLNDTSFAQESIVGIDAADKTRTAAFLPQFGATLSYDQLFPQPTAGSTYAGLFFHRYAIAMRTAPLQPMGDSNIKEITVYPRPNLPVRIQMANSIAHQGVVINLNCAYGRAVVRATHGAYAVST